MKPIIFDNSEDWDGENCPHCSSPARLGMVPGYRTCSNGHGWRLPHGWGYSDDGPLSWPARILLVIVALVCLPMTLTGFAAVWACSKVRA